MSTFQIQGNDTNILLVDTDYHKWLLSKDIKTIHSISTKIEYLSTKGFVKGVDKLSWEDLSTLRHIEQHYFHTVIRPTLS